LSIVDELKFFYFHHHHYSHVPADLDDVQATWVTYPNSRYDPVLGHELYKRHMRTIRLADQLGFDGVTINEHHNTIYSMTPTVSVMAAAIAPNAQVETFAGTGHLLVDEQPAVIEAIRAFAKSAAGV
jgi:hypothetical protein